jgi:hypothetical protein
MIAQIPQSSDKAKNLNCKNISNSIRILPRKKAENQVIIGVPFLLVKDILFKLTMQRR